MTKKHYEAIARVFKYYHKQIDQDVYSAESVKHLLIHIANELADFMQTDNQNFDHDRFTKACIG